MKSIDNEMTLCIKSKSINESFARSCVAAFCAQLNPSLEELNDLKTAVSEAVTNSIVHGYPDKMGIIKIKASLAGDKIIVEIIDNGVGIDDIEKAKEPFFSTKPDDERSGMGFTVMESFMDNVVVSNTKGGGVTVKLTKQIFGSTYSKKNDEEENNQCFLMKIQSV